MVDMGMTAGADDVDSVHWLKKAAAIELLCACQALDDPRGPPGPWSARCTPPSASWSRPCSMTVRPPTTWRRCCRSSATARPPRSCAPRWNCTPRRRRYSRRDCSCPDRPPFRSAPRIWPTGRYADPLTSTISPRPPACREPTSAVSSPRVRRIALRVPADPAAGARCRAAAQHRSLGRRGLLLRSVAEPGSFTTSFTRTYGLSPTAYRARDPPASALAVVPSCAARFYGRPQRRTFREDRAGRSGLAWRHRFPVNVRRRSR